MSAKEIFEKLVHMAGGYAWRLSSSLRSKQNYGKPGELLDRLSLEERKELSNLTSEDVKDADRDIVNYILGNYPESNITIHTHSIKKNDD